MSRDQLIVACILKSLRSMSDPDRGIFIKKHYHGWEEEQIALSYGLSAEDVHVSLHRSSMALLQNLHPLAFRVSAS